MKLKNRLFLSIFSASFITLILTLLCITRVMYGNMSDELRTEVKNEAQYLSLAIDDVEQAAAESFITEAGQKSVNRITLVSNDGTVLYDNFADSATLENHLNRPEIKAAQTNGSGEITRSSDTLREQTYYYAVRLENGLILRIATTTKSLGGLLGTSVIWLVIVAAAVLCAAAIMSKFLTASVIKPINELDLDDPVSNITYDELSPLLTRMDKQSEKINRQISTLSEQKREFAFITENMTEGLVIFGKNGNILTANNSAKKILGNENAATYPELCRSTDYINAVEAALKGKYSNIKFEKNGGIYQLTVNPVEDTEKYGAVLFLVDITDRETSEQMRREFSANVSHELKTPLTSIMGAAEIIQNGIAKAADVPHFAGQIHTEASRLLVLIEDIIKLSRLDEDNLMQEFSENDLDLICRDITAQLEGKAKSKNVTVSYKGEPIKINGVRPVLHEMIFNLCDNAIAYNKPNGTVTISLSQTDGKKILSVSDTGIGIAPEHQSRVFERFYRVDKSHSKETGGTGLGLSIVKHGAILHNGTVSLDSEVGKGTTVTVIFE